jgi:putative iron-regulated protein
MREFPTGASGAGRGGPTAAAGLLAAFAALTSVAFAPAAHAAQSPPQAPTAAPPAPAAPPSPNSPAADAARCYAQTAAHACATSAEDAAALRRAIDRFCDAPSEATLRDAREAWLAGRRSYGETEALRFAGGPIDARRGGVETFVNAWPVDESYIEPPGARGRGLVGDRAKYPTLAPVALRALNQHGGETNVCTGWHAIEFMLWGHPADEQSAGARPAADFFEGAPDADRRREYLRAIAQMLAEDLAAVAKAWQPGAAHRAAMETRPEAALRAMLVGTALLSAFEMGGERLAVAVETRDRHEQTSCFSNSSDEDLRANLRGVARVLRGEGCTGAIAVVRTRDPAAADQMEAALVAATAAAKALPANFARAIRQPPESPEHAQLVAAMQSFERLGAAITAGAKAMGMTLPTEPPG